MPGLVPRQDIEDGDTATTATMTTMDDTFVTSSLKAELLPIVLGVIGKIQGQRFAKSLTLLFDTGATSTWINKKVLPSGIQIDHTKVL